MEFNNRNYIIFQINSSTASRRDICFKRRIKFQMAYLFEYSSPDKQLTFVYIWEWMEVNDRIYIIIKKSSSSASRRDIICLSWLESFNNIQNNCSSSSFPYYTIRGHQICYYHNNNFPKIIKNLRKMSCVTPGHYDCPFRNINIVLFFLNLIYG